MKNYLTVVGLLFLAFGVQAQHTITVNFSKLKPVQGQIYVGLYNSKEDFMKVDKNFRNCITPVNSDKAVCILENVPAGTYALSVFHDENGNGELDTGMFGIPKEGYGFSNNASGMFGPPSFEDSSFEVKDDVVQQIDL